MLNFRIKKQLSEYEKSIIKRLSLFYSMYGNVFVEFSNISQKKEIIKDIYKKLCYDNIPKLYSPSEISHENEIVIYRGISANNTEDLIKYVNQFINGDIFYGGRASIYGTGIYTVVGKDSSIAYKYASDGGINNCGIVIESKLDTTAKIINFDELQHIKEFVFEKMRKIYKSNIENFLAILEDDGALAAILGYDAIYVGEKEYMIVLNRGKMIINESDLSNKLDLVGNAKKR